MRGSSPLARGLHPRTANRRRPDLDHPRSRGVYPGPPARSRRLPGSSPLARGLPRADRPRRREVRIIPARAGFTRGRSPTRPCWGDHPRSRGVYYFSPGEADSRAGSSPLARGLRHRLRLAGWGAGIIPARAGFTGQDAQMRRHLADHPRSRGVYLQWRRRPVAPQGIIPARAGFTSPSGAVGSGSGDHPRSRGVYGTVSHRGLSRMRIIPARAGFTPLQAGTSCRAKDHPRSRGVYGDLTRPLGGNCGSSPLARGLPRGKAVASGAKGIIPARAGFTGEVLLGFGEDADHPRSRGVYGCIRRIRGLRRGSSPLARGLPSIQDRMLVSARIIPARAGFTDRRADPRPSDPDHPRSRGVYAIFSLCSMRSAGSSPLARGLHSPHDRCLPRSGIIPARAGFTSARCRSPRGSADHPRSRGVYQASS